MNMVSGTVLRPKILMIDLARSDIKDFCHVYRGMIPSGRSQGVGWCAHLIFDNYIDDTVGFEYNNTITNLEMITMSQHENTKPNEPFLGLMDDDGDDFLLSAEGEAPKACPLDPEGRDQCESCQ